MLKENQHEAQQILARLKRSFKRVEVTPEQVIRIWQVINRADCVFEIPKSPF